MNVGRAQLIPQLWATFSHWATQGLKPLVHAQFLPRLFLLREILWSFSVKSQCSTTLASDREMCCAFPPLVLCRVSDTKRDSVTPGTATCGYCTSGKKKKNRKGLPSPKKLKYTDLSKTTTYMLEALIFMAFWERIIFWKKPKAEFL